MGGGEAGGALARARWEEERRRILGRFVFVPLQENKSEPSAGTVRLTHPTHTHSSIERLKSSHLEGPVQLSELKSVCEVPCTSISCRAGQR